MDFYSHSFRKHLFKSLSRKLIKSAKGNLKDLDVIVSEYCLIALREEYNFHKGVFEILKVQRLFRKFESIVIDLDKINTNLINLLEEVSNLIVKFF